jgi:CNT family concentrative nucleoside transporter
MDDLRGIVGMTVLIALAVMLSSDRRRFPWKIVLGGLALQWILAWIVLKTDPGQAFFDAIGRVVTAILHGADAGANFVFGELAGNNDAVAWKAIAGIKIMTTIVIVATLSAIGYHYGILQRIVATIAWCMRRTMGVSGAESLAAAANVFFGQTEAPLLVKPYIDRMTRSELMALMTGGFATVAAGVMAVYVSILSGGDEEVAVAIARHLLTACLMSAPAAFVMAKIMVPEVNCPETGQAVTVHVERQTQSLVDAATTGASQGMKLAINVLAMLIAFVALIAVVDIALVWVGQWVVMRPVVAMLGLEQLNLVGILGLVFWPIAWLLGAAPEECRTLAALLGKAMTTTELIAYDDLARLSAESQMSPRTITIATYAMCGFANISSIGIQIGGIGILAPSRRADLVALGPRAMLGGAMACWMTGCIAGVML